MGREASRNYDCAILVTVGWFSLAMDGSSSPSAGNEQSFEFSHAANANALGSDSGNLNAVLIGALASGVNGPTWGTVKLAMLSLGVSLLLLICIAWQYSNAVVLFHVLCFTLIALLLFILLKWFISEIGLVTMEQQMAELNGPVKETAKEK